MIVYTRTVKAPIVTRRYSLVSQREVGLEPTFDEPVVIQRSAHVTRAPARSAVGVGSVHVRPRHVAAVHTGRSGGHVRSSSVPASARQPVRRSRLADLEATKIEADSYLNSPPTVSLSELRARALDARSKLDTHKTLLDKYLPVSMGPDVAVEHEVARKYSQLVDRMPELDRYRSPTLTSATATKPPVAPYKAVSRPRSNSESVGPQLRGNFRPQVSETRRRLREVICSTRKDPRYFD